MTPSSRPTKRIGALLVERGFITQRHLDDALTQQRSTGEFLGAILVKRGILTPETLMKVVADQFGLPLESLDPLRIDWRVAQQFPASVLVEGKCFPIRADATSVTIAITNPLDAWSLSSVGQGIRGRTIKPVLVLESDLRAVIQAYRQWTLEALASQLDAPRHDKTQ